MLKALVIVILLFSTTFWGAPLVSGKLPNGYSDFKKKVPSYIEISIIDWETAHTLFKKFKEDPNIPFDFLPEGCFARTTAMTKIAKDNGVKMGRIIAEGDLLARTNNPLIPVIAWGWHVAAIVFVKGAGGNSEKVVFDPSLFNEPVTEETWLKKMQLSDGFGFGAFGRVKEVYYGNYNQYFRRKNKQGLGEYYRTTSYTDSKLGEFSMKNILSMHRQFLDNSTKLEKEKKPSSGNISSETIK